MAENSRPIAEPLQKGAQAAHFVRGAVPGTYEHISERRYIVPETDLRQTHRQQSTLSRAKVGTSVKVPLMPYRLRLWPSAIIP